MNKLIIAMIALAVIGAYFFFRPLNNQNSKEFESENPSLSMPAPGFESVTETVVSPNNGDNMTVEASLKEIDIVSGNFSFNPKNLTVTKNQPVKITFQNTGTHTFTIDELGVNISLVGNSGIAEFTPTKVGTFEYYCAFPGHRERGMVGSLSVE